MFTHTQRSKFYDLSCSDCLRLKVTGFKRNYLPYLSVLPFCLVALSTSFAFNSEAAEVPQPTENTTHEISGGGVFQFRQEEFTANLIEITGSIYQGDSSAIIGGYATDYAVKGNIVESKWGNLNSAYIERLIIAGSLSNWADTTKEGIVAGNKVILNNEDPNDKKSTLCGIIGGKVQGSGSLTAKNNQIQVDGLVEYESWYVGEVIGAQVVEGFGVAENNTVSISNGSHRGDVIGAEGTNNTSQTTISSNAVNIVNATTYGYVYGGRIESLSAGASGVVLGNTVTGFFSLFPLAFRKFP